MDYIKRAIESSFLKKMRPNKVMVLLGARRIGKTSFLKELMKKFKEPFLLLNGEDLATAESLKPRTVENYNRLLGGVRLLIIDEAQKIPDIGAILKLMIDEVPGLKIIATGSSMFDLTNKLGEPLTGRSITFYMYPLAQMELSKQETLLQTKSRLQDRLIYGGYPELQQYSGRTEKAGYLREIVNAYLLRDIMAFDGVRNSAKLIDLLRLIAFQIGKEVSVHELAQQLGITRATVERYLDLLSKVFIIYRLQAFSRNLRSEIVKNSKWYFYDNGIRNTLISNLNTLTLRNDLGELWENYVLSERIKKQQYTNIFCTNYFWRTYQGQEIDWIEEREGKLHAFEIKWNANKKVKEPSAWKEAYTNSQFSMIHPGNYLNWVE